MPKLFVPHVRQIEDGYCLPACVEMVLAFIAQLTHWHGEESQHVVLLIAIQGDIDGIATINDPAFDAPMNLPMNELILAWLDRDNYFATIRRK